MSVTGSRDPITLIIEVVRSLAWNADWLVVPLTGAVPPLR